MEISAKELGFLKEQLKEEELLIRKYRHYAAVSSDPELQSEYEKTAAKHEGHFNSLLRYLG